MIYLDPHNSLGFPGGSVVKKLHANAGDARNVGSVSGWRRSVGLGNGNPLQYSRLKNSMNSGSMGSQKIRHG